MKTDLHETIRVQMTRLCFAKKRLSLNLRNVVFVLMDLHSREM